MLFEQPQAHCRGVAVPWAGVTRPDAAALQMPTEVGRVVQEIVECFSETVSAYLRMTAQDDPTLSFLAGLYAHKVTCMPCSNLWRAGGGLDSSLTEHDRGGRRRRAD